MGDQSSTPTTYISAPFPLLTVTSPKKTLALQPEYQDCAGLSFVFPALLPPSYPSSQHLGTTLLSTIPSDAQKDESGLTHHNKTLISKKFYTHSNMRLVSLHALALLCCGVAVAQDCINVALTAIPGCAQNCILNGAPSIGCQGTDFSCQCAQSAALYAAVEGCVSSACPSASYQAVIDGSEEGMWLELFVLGARTGFSSFNYMSQQNN